jgi:hypothetical protein
MITKKRAQQIYNLYSQLETSNKLLNTLRQCKDEYEKNSEGIDIIRDQWGQFQSIELAVPERFLNPNGSSFSGARIFQISIPDAILVLESHIQRLEKSLIYEQKEAQKD